MKRIICLLLLIPHLVFAQKKSTVDSLKNLLEKNLPNKTRVDILNELALTYAKTDSTQTFKYTLTAKPIAGKIKYQKGIALLQRAQGISLSYKNHLKEALELLNSSANIYISLKAENEEGEIYNDIGIAYKLLNYKDEALLYFKKAEGIHRKIKNSENLATDLNNMGAAYKQMGLYDKAVASYIESGNLQQMVNGGRGIFSTYINLGELLIQQNNYKQAQVFLGKAINMLKSGDDQLNLGIACLDYANAVISQSQYGEGVSRINQALAAFTKANFKRGIQVCYNNLGAVFIRQKKFQESIPWLERSLRMSEESKNYAGYALTQQNMAFALANMGRLAEAEKLFNESEQSAVKFKGDIAVFAEIYNHRATLDSLQGNYKRAFFDRNKAFVIKDSLLNEKLTKQVNELQTKYESEKKEKQIAQLNHQTALQQLKLTKSKLLVENQQLILGKNKLQLETQNLELSKKESLLSRKQLETERKQQQIKLLNKENTIQKLTINRRNMIIGTVSGLLILSIILGILFYNRYRMKQEAKLQLEIIRQQDMATRGILEAEERERKRIAADLHDGIGQLFSTVRLNLGSLVERVNISNPEDIALAEKTMAMVDESCKEVRSIAHQMMPNILLKTGLASAVKDFVSKIDAEKLKVTLETSGLNERLSNNMEIVLYRVIQECVNNVIKHARANRLDIQLDRTETEISVTVEDNGRGFDTADKEKFEGIGFKNILTRLAYLKGTADFSSSPGKGTLVAIYVPLA